MNLAALSASPRTMPSTADQAGGAASAASGRSEREKAKLMEARNALQALRRPTGQASEERKAMARQKVEQLRARIRMLQMNAALDPKGTARLSTQLARELAAAVKAYAAAGGSTSDLGGAATSASGAAGPADDNTSAAAAETSDEAAEAAVEADPNEKTVDDGLVASPQEEDEPGRDEDPYRKLMEELNARGAELARRGSEIEDDRDFMTKVKALAEALKASLAQARKRGGLESSDDRRAADEAMADLEKEIAEADKALNPGVSLIV